MMKEKLAVVTEIISPYRVPVFNRIVEILGDRFKVFFMSATCRGREWEVPYSKIKFNYEILRGIDLNITSTSPNPRFWNSGVDAALREFSPSVIVIGGYHHFTSHLVRNYAKLNATRLFLWCESTLYDKHSKNPFIRKLKKKFIRSCDGYLVPGKASGDYLSSLGASDSFFRAPNTIDMDLFCADQNESELKKKRMNFRKQYELPEFVVLFVGRLSSEKNIPMVFQVIQGLQTQGIQVGLVIVGEGPMRRKYETLVPQLQLENVHFVGFKQQEELPYYYHVSDVLILPSVSEPWGLVVNEALACGLPVLCSEKVGCAPDLVLEGRTGYSCSHITDYQNRILDLYDNPKQLESMREHCLKHINSFTPEQCAEGFLNLINREKCLTLTPN